ncbi:MAG: caspase family protein [Burkholderiales bacterium]|nr:caspase family protein [Burkholderiales bacterium]
MGFFRFSDTTGRHTLWRALVGAVLGLCAVATLAAGEERPLLVVEQGAHSAPVRRIEASATLGLVVTASDDRTARVWALASGELQLILRPPAFGAEGGRLYAVAIHPSEPLVAVGGTTGGEGQPHQIYLFDLQSGALRRTIDAQAGDIRKLAWSHDGSLLLAGYAGTHGVRVFALDGRPLFDKRLDGPVFGLATASNGLAAVVSLEGRLLTYRASAGTVAPLADVTLGKRRAAGVAFSPDGRQLVVAYADKDEPPEIFDAQTGSPVARLPVAKVHGGDYRTVAWSADGRFIYSGGTARSVDDQFAVLQYDVASRALLGQLTVARDSVTDLDMLPNGDLAYSSFDGSWGIVSGGRIGRRVASKVSAIRGDVPADLELSADATAARWGMKSADGGLGFRFEKRALSVRPADPLRAPETRFGWFSAPGDVNNQRRAPVIGGKPMALADDERSRAATVIRASSTAIVGTNRALYAVSEQGAVLWRMPVDTEVRGVNASVDGRLVVSAMADGTLRWWRARDGGLLMTLLASSDGRWVVWTPSGYYDASAGADQIVGWALGQGPQRPMAYYSLNRFRDRFNRPDVIDALLKTLDETEALRLLASQESAQRDAVVADARATDQAARAAEREAANQASLARQAAQREADAQRAALQAAKERAAVAELARQAEARQRAARDQAERDAAAREVAARQAEAAEVQSREAEKKAVAQEAQHLLARVVAMEEAAAREAAALALVSRLAAEEAAAQEARIKAKRLLTEIKATEFPPALSAAEARRLKVSGAEVKLSFVVSSSGPNAELRVEVRLNGRPAQPSELVVPRSLDGATRGHARLDVAEGESLVEIIASNKFGASEPLAFTIERPVAVAIEVRPGPAPVAPAVARQSVDLYVLAIGVSDYARTDYNLGLPAKDARDFAATMKAQEGKLYRRVIVRTLTNREATRANIQREFEWLRGAVGPADVAMLFMAGHGLNDTTGQYFFVPHDGQHERLLATAVSQDTIVATLSKIRGRTLFFVDTCFAGNSLGALRQGGRKTGKTEKMMNDLSSSENGVVVFASSTGQEESEEKAEWGNGAFTKAVIDGLGGKADFMRAGRVTFAGLNLFVSEEVVRITNGRQRPVFISPRGIPDFALSRL